MGYQVPALDRLPAWKGEVFVGKGHGWDIAWLCFLLKHVTIWFPCLEVVNSCSEQRRMVLLHWGWVSFYEPWKVVLFTGKGWSTHICQFILEHINPSKHQEGNKVAWCGYDLDHDMNIAKCSSGRKKIWKYCRQESRDVEGFWDRIGDLGNSLEAMTKSLQLRLRRKEKVWLVVKFLALFECPDRWTGCSYTPL